MSASLLHAPVSPVATEIAPAGRPPAKRGWCASSWSRPDWRHEGSSTRSTGTSPIVSQRNCKTNQCVRFGHISVSADGLQNRIKLRPTIGDRLIANVRDEMVDISAKHIRFVAPRRTVFPPSAAAGRIQPVGHARFRRRSDRLRPPAWDALIDVAARYKATGSKSVVISYGASSTLAQQPNRPRRPTSFSPTSTDERARWTPDRAGTRVAARQRHVLVAPKAATIRTSRSPRVRTFTLLGRMAGSPWPTSTPSRPANTARRRSMRWASGRASQCVSSRPTLSAPRSPSSPAAKRRWHRHTTSNAELVIGTFGRQPPAHRRCPAALVAESRCQAFYDFEIGRRSHVKQGSTVRAGLDLMFRR